MNQEPIDFVKRGMRPPVTGEPNFGFAVPWTPLGVSEPGLVFAEDNQAMNPADRANILSHLHEPEMLDWAEDEARGALQACYDEATWIAEQSSSTLTILLAGIGGSLAFGLAALGATPTPVDKAAAACCAYLSLLTLVLCIQCLTIRRIPPVYFDPSIVLYAPGVERRGVRHRLLLRMQTKLDEMRARNDRRSRALNGVRIAATALPLAFLLAWVYFR